MRRLVYLLLSVMLAGCATGPRLPEGKAADEPSPQAVRDAPEQARRQRVRWGGRILFVDNHDAHTQIGVLAYPLNSAGRPLEDADAGARFLARVDGFLDPAVYAAEREWSAVGVIAGIETREVGDYPYRYPILDVSRHQLWPERKAVAERPYPPYYRDPWWPHYGPYPGWPGRYPFWY